MRSRGGFRDCRGQALVEFALCAVILLALLFAVVEFGRMMLCYTTIANAARIGARYAITHGTIPGSTNATNSDVSNMQSSVESAVNGFLAAGTVNPSTATVTVAFPALTCTGANPTDTCTGTTPGQLVSVTVSYLYDPLTSYFPLSGIRLKSTSEGVITW